MLFPSFVDVRGRRKDGVILTLGDGWGNPSLGTRGGFCRMV
jgi:hypothetical protein